MEDDIIWCASFDIGKNNFCFYIEEMNVTALKKIKNIPDNEQYNENGTLTDKMDKLLNEVFVNGKTIIYKNSNLTYNCKKGKKLDPETYHNMVDLLDEYSEYWDKCSYFIIEEQMKINTMALKLGQHCYSYFVYRYGRFKKVIEFPSRHKTQVLGCERIKGKKCKNGKFRWKTIDKPARKKWSIVKAREILHSRGEQDIIDNIKTISKKDDISDCITQLNSYKYLYFVNKSI